MTGPLPLTRPLDVAAVPPGGTARSLVATDSERQSLAAALDILSVESLEADLTIVPWRAEGLEVTGRLRARVTQSCVVSLVPVAQEIDESIDVRLVPMGSKLAASTDAEGHVGSIEMGEEDPPENFSGHSIDLGAIVSEHLALALDPYPRAPGAELPAEFSEPQAERSSPFAVLEKLKNRGGIKG